MAAYHPQQGHRPFDSQAGGVDPLIVHPPIAHPLVAHPLFGTALTLWFAALFSLTTLAIRGAVLEGWVLASQIDLLIPAATPPLGFTARLLVALVVGGAGAGAGALLARLLTAPLRHRSVPYGEDAGLQAFMAARAPATDGFRVRARDAHPDAPARRPIRAHEELGGGDLDTPPPDFFDVYPIPAVAAPIEPAPIEPISAPPPFWGLQPTVAQVVAPPEPHPQPEAAPDLASEPTIAPVPAQTAAERIASSPLPALSHVELVERLAILLERRYACHTVAGADRGEAAVSGETARGEAIAEADRSPAPQATPPAPAPTEDSLRAALASLRGLK